MAEDLEKKTQSLKHAEVPITEVKALAAAKTLDQGCCCCGSRPVAKGIKSSYFLTAACTVIW